MKHKIYLLGAATALMLTGCIDDKYDLSDIDTTSQFKVNDLVIPVNLEPVVLSDIIKVEEGDKLKEVTIDGNTFYAIEQTGDFNSDDIEVTEFDATPDPMNDQKAIFKVDASAAAKGRALKAKSFKLEAPVIEDLIFEAYDIDGSIRTLEEINFKPLNLDFYLSTDALSGNIDSKLQGVVLYLPSGLKVSKIAVENVEYSVSGYNPSDGKLTFSQPIALNEGKAKIVITAESIDLGHYKNPTPYIYDPDRDSGSFILKSVFNFDSATLLIEGEDSFINDLSEVDFNIHYEVDRMDALSIMGNIAYDLSGTGLNIEPIDLEDMPSFLEDPETNLMLSNPQIYLQMSNPIGKYGLGYQSSLDIISIRENGHQETFSSPEIKVNGKEGTYNYLLAPYPEKVIHIPSDFTAGINKMVYNNLGEILAGNGLPKTLDIKLIDPEIPEQSVTAPFELGQYIEAMEGNYMFLAPLSLKEGSKIVKSVDGWWSEDLSDLYIDYLTINADATNGLPTGVILNIYAIDRDGKQISTTGSLKLDENAVNDPIEVTLTGLDGKPFNNLDGIQIYVLAGSNDGDPLAPDQVITLENIKAKVTGNYTRKL